MPNGEGNEGNDSAHDTESTTHWSDLVLTIVIALAAVGTAWAGFQSAKWGGVQASSYARAGALRTESTRQSTQAGQFTTMDVITFTDWLAAVNDERAKVPNRGLGTGYTPDPTTLSGILYERFRPEFQPAVRAWIDTRPLVTKGAPATPFVMPEYRLASREKADELLRDADGAADLAADANQRSDNYVMTAVLVALVLFFATLTGRTRGGPSRWVLLVLTVVCLVTAGALLVSFPVQL